MSSWHLTYKKLTEIARVERARKDAIYPAGTIYVQVSACKKNTEKIWNVLDAKGNIETKYAVIIPTIEVIPAYLVLALERVTPEWHSRYIGTNINIDMNAFRYLDVAYHADVSEQAKVLSEISIVDEQIREVEEVIKLHEEAKKWFLAKLLI